MSEKARLWIFGVAVLVFALLLVRGVIGLPGFGRYPGPYGDYINGHVVPQRHATNGVTAINFDYRGFDTLGEEYILFAAVTGVALVSRGRQGESEDDPPAPVPGRQQYDRSEAVKWAGFGLIGMLDIFGIYMVAHGQLTPGGGFQGGALLGTGSMMAYLATNYRVYRRVNRKPMVEAGESSGIGAYALVGIVTLLCGGAFLENMLPLGKSGDLLSSGTIAVINLAVGLAVSGGFALLFADFLRETRAPAEEPKEEK